MSTARIALCIAGLIVPAQAASEPYLCVLPKGCEPTAARYTSATRDLTLTCVVDGVEKTYQTNIAQFLPFDQATGRYKAKGSDVTGITFMPGEAEVPLCIPAGPR